MYSVYYCVHLNSLMVHLNENVLRTNVNSYVFNLKDIYCICDHKILIMF